MSDAIDIDGAVTFGADAPMGDGAARHNVVLTANHEWRFEVKFDARITVRLIEGTAELFGTEIARGREYEFIGQNGAIFTYHGCKLEWEGDCSEYVAANPMMAKYANVHFALEKLRIATQNSEKAAPRVMILGSRNSGKSTLAKVLVSYATKVGRFPMLINLDPMNSVFSPPGSLVAAPVSHILDIEDGFGLSPINGPAATHHKQPLVYNFALQSPTDSPFFYEHLVSRLADGVNSRLLGDQRVKESGMIIDTPDAFADADEDLKLELVSHCVQELKITTIIVIGKERLTSKLQRTLSNETQVLNIVQSGGTTEDDDAFIRQMQRRSIAEYFFGNSRQTLSPFTVTVPLHDVVVYRPLEQAETTVSDESQQYLTKVEPSSVLQNCLLAVLNAEPTDPASVVADAETLGYVHIVEADDNKKILKVLLPVPGTVPRKAFMMGTFRYHE